MNTIRVLVSVFLITFTANNNMAQNLLKNSSFEILKSNDPIVKTGNPDDFAYKVPDWALVSTYAIVCTVGYREGLVNPSSYVCGSGNIAPYDGNAMIELEYSPNCNAPWMKQPGCAGYIGQSLVGTMEFGQAYELSMMIYISPTNDPEYAKHIGVQFYTEALPFSANKLLDGHEFSLDTVLFGQWYEVSWIIKPKCDLEFVVFGVFKNENGPPTHGRHVIDNRYFIDDVRLVKMPENTVGVTPFCKSRPVSTKPMVLPGLSVYFDNGAASIKEEFKPALDTFALTMKHHPKTVFRISGHTDPTGNNHIELSKERIDSVLTYLQRKHKVNPLRFVRVPLGAGVAVASEQDQEDYRRGRRVSIVGAESPPQRVLYRHILQSVYKSQHKLATNWMAAWLQMATEREIMLAQHDPRLKNLLHRNPLQRQLMRRKADIYSSIDRRNGKPFLDSIWQQDQLPRTLGRYVENLNYYWYQIDTSKKAWSVSYPQITGPEIVRRDSTHKEIIVNWLQINSWPKISMVGELAAKAVPLVLLHSGDTTTISHYLPEFYTQCREGEADWSYYALLFDRNQVLRNEPQRYGTQYQKNSATGKQELCPIEDWERMNKFRQEIGFRTIKSENAIQD